MMLASTKRQGLCMGKQHDGMHPCALTLQLHTGGNELLLLADCKSWRREAVGSVASPPSPSPWSLHTGKQKQMSTSQIKGCSSSRMSQVVGARCVAYFDELGSRCPHCEVADA